jgi:predicted O-linked N-acetylglucosamine transferase (SPINDLY family)
MSNSLNEEYKSDLQVILDLFYQKKFIDSEDKLKNLIIKFSNDSVLENIYGAILSSQGKYEEALEKFIKAIKLNPSFAEANYNVATTLLKLSRDSEAVDYFKKSIDLKGDYFDAYFNLANCYKKLENFKDSIDAYNQCIKYKPNDPEVHNNLGLVYFSYNKLDLAIVSFQKCLEIDAEFFLAYNNLGLIFLTLKDYEKAISFFNKTIKINIGFAQAYNNLGLALFENKKISSSIIFFEKAISLDNKFYNAYLNLARALKSNYNYHDAIKILEKIIIQTKKNNLLLILSKSLGILAQCYCEIGELKSSYKAYEESINISVEDRDILKNYIFAYNYNEEFDLNEYFKIIDIYKKSLKIIEKDKLGSFVYKNNTDKIKIGFVSADFKKQAVGYQIYGILEKLSKKNELELFAYYNDFDEDDLNLKFKSIFSHWNNVKQVSDLDLINKIRSDGIHILVDLSGYTSGNRLEIFFNKAAPIQVSWAGYLASTGLKEIDYIITDPHVASIKEEDQFVEKLCKQEHVWCNLTYPETVDISEKTPAFENGFITFGSFNNISKINLKVIDLWAKIISSVNNCRLYLKSSQFNDLEIKKKYQNYFLDKGNIKLQQLIFEPDSNRRTLFNSYNKVDIALDTFPYSGGTTSLEAAWMCVPILTKRGNSFLSKCGESININSGLEDWICKNEDEYFKKAISFSSDLKKLQLIKNTLKINRNKNKIFDSDSFSNNLTKSFKDMWNNFNV